jgi:hypothetical protein
MDEGPLEQGIKLANHQMVHNPVAKVCSEDFTLNRAINNKRHCAQACTFHH